MLSNIGQLHITGANLTQNVYLNNRKISVIPDTRS